jgi:hypothetical protein
MYYLSPGYFVSFSTLTGVCIFVTILTTFIMSTKRGAKSKSVRITDRDETSATRSCTRLTSRRSSVFTESEHMETTEEPSREPGKTSDHKRSIEEAHIMDCRYFERSICPQGFRCQSYHSYDNNCKDGNDVRLHHRG